MDARIPARAEVHPAPGDSTITRAFLRFGRLKRLMFCLGAIAELESLPRPTLSDQLLLEKYRAARRRLLDELGLIKRWAP